MVLYQDFDGGFSWAMSVSFRAGYPFDLDTFIELHLASALPFFVQQVLRLDQEYLTFLLGGGFKYVLLLPLCREMIPFDSYVFKWPGLKPPTRK